MNLNEILEDLYHELLYNSTLCQEDIDIIIDKIKKKHIFPISSTEITNSIPVDFKYCKKCSSNWFYKLFPKMFRITNDLKNNIFCTTCKSKLETGFYGSYCSFCDIRDKYYKDKNCSKCNNSKIIGA